MSKKAAVEDGTGQKRRKRNKKPKDMPKRPLSAYNLFFAEERERILGAQRQGIHQADFILPTEEEADRQKQQGKKRAPVLFQALARCVGKRWNALNEHAKKKYERQAEEEMKKYRVKMEEYQQNIVMNTMAQSAKQKRKKDKTESEGDSYEGASPSKPPKKQATAKSNVKTNPVHKNKTLSSPSGLDGSQSGSTASGRQVSGLPFQQAASTGTTGASNISQVAQQPQFQSSSLLQTSLTGGGNATTDSSLFSSQYGGSNNASSLGSSGGTAAGQSGMLPHYQQYNPYLQQQSQQQNQGLGLPQQSQQSNALFLEQVLLQRQQQQAAALMSGAMGMGTGAPSDLLALQLQQSQQPMMQSGNQSALFNYLANQQSQQQQPYGLGGASSAGTVGGMDLSNPSSGMHSQQQMQQRSGGMWDSDGQGFGGGGADNLVGGQQDAGGMGAAQQQAFSSLLQQNQFQQFFPQDQQQQQSGIQALFNYHSGSHNSTGNPDDHGAGRM